MSFKGKKLLPWWDRWRRQRGARLGRACWTCCVPAVHRRSNAALAGGAAARAEHCILTVSLCDSLNNRTSNRVKEKTRTALRSQTIILRRYIYTLPARAHHVGTSNQLLQYYSPSTRCWLCDTTCRYGVYIMLIKQRMDGLLACTNAVPFWTINLPRRWLCDPTGGRLVCLYNQAQEKDGWAESKIKKIISIHARNVLWCW